MRTASIIKGTARGRRNIYRRDQARAVPPFSEAAGRDFRLRNWICHVLFANVYAIASLTLAAAR